MSSRMEEFDRLVEVMAQLRGPDGCPWDREQTHQTLKPYLLEECYEALEAVDARDDEKLCGELGDVLLQVVFHAQLAAERHRFNIRDVCNRIVEKLLYRHPHVFGDVEVSDSEQVLRNWEQLKRREREAPAQESALDGVPSVLPALKQATALQKKASRVGFDWDDVSGPVRKLHEELDEFSEARDDEDREAMTQELGDVLFALVNVARLLGIDSEDALRMASARFTQRFRYVEAKAAEAGRNLQEMSLQEMDKLWEEAKLG